MNRSVCGVVYKTIVQIITWDWVLEPGIKQANKWANLSTESIDYMKFNIDDLVNKSSKVYKEIEMALESDDSKEMMKEIVSNIKSKQKYDILNRW